MNSVESEPALIGIDWGTSSLRAFLMGPDGEVLDRVSKPQGIMHVEKGDFEGTFDALVGTWIAKDSLPIIASGMITSRNGWIETPYVNVPAGATELAAALVPLTTAKGITVNFITGMTMEHCGIPDAMRGEETQIIGACALGMEDGVFVLPGTHSKWITIHGKRIEEFATYMTGELFDALRKHTILGSLMNDGPFHEAAFRMGVAAGLAKGARLLHDLFSVRSLPLFGKISSDMVADYLSGILIGAEIGGVDASTVKGAATIVGRDDLADRYDIALGVANLKSRRAQDDIVARGHLMIAKAAGLLS